jgi:hypothetical protein
MTLRARRLMGWALLAFALGLARPSSAADGLVLAADELGASERNKLAAEVEAHRRSRPGPFVAVARTCQHLSELGRQLRDPAPALAAELRPLGREALWPLLEVLALQAPATEGASDAQRQALGAGMLEALGVLRDARAATVLRAAFLRSRSRAVVQAAALGLGRLCDDASFALLTERASGSGVRARSAVAGLGQCRRLESAERLAALLEDAQSSPEAAAAAQALGHVGSSWAWRALGRARDAEALAAREVAARALLRGYARAPAATRPVLGRALAMVEHQATRRLAAQLASELDPEARATLDRVIARIERRVSR